MIGALLTVALSLPGESAPSGVSSVAFSRESGFYSDGFALELSAVGGEIHYTLDCTDPDTDSPVYTGPIEITDASLNENRYSMETGVSVEFREELLREANSTLYYGYDLPKGLVDKATVVRAVCVGPDGECGPVSNAVYFVDYDDKEGYQGMRVIAIATDPKNLFDPKTGIYVTGNVFERTLTSDGHIAGSMGSNYGTWEANYNRSGRKWEREAYVCCFDEHRNILFSGNYGLRVQGGTSRALLPKSLNLFARKEYGAGSFSYEALFGMSGKLDSINLHSGAQCLSTKLNDYIINEHTKDLNFCTREYVPTMVFLDGEFWGFCWMTPRYEEEYFKYRYNVYDDDLIVMKAGVTEIGTAYDKEDYYRTMIAELCDLDMSDPANYERARELIDIDSCVDYFATEIYVANVDWPHHNVQLWRTREVSSGPCSDTRWRWIMYDANISMELSYAQRDMVEWAARRSEMFGSLMENEAFADAIYRKLVELARVNFNPSEIDDFIDDYKLFMADAMEKEYARFYGDNKTVDSFLAGCDRIKQFFDLRYDYIMEKYGEYGEAQ